MIGDLTPRQEAARQRIHDLLAELADIIGPHTDGQADGEPGHEPHGTPTPWDYVLVCCWFDAHRSDYITVLPAAGMLNRHTVGLLRAALAYGDDMDSPR